MAITKEQLQKMAAQLDEVVHLIQQQDKEAQPLLNEVCPMYRESAQNLMHYAAFRGFDARSMQKGLKQLGLTRLANSEGNILGSLINLKIIVESLLGNTKASTENKFLSIGEGKRLLRRHTDQLFGENNKPRRVRIMVTQPSEAATNYDLVRGMVKNGMDCARINCAHDGPEVWEKIIDNIREAAKECSKTVKISMDLSGPKIRTGKIGDGPQIKKFKPLKNIHGEKAVGFITLVPEGKKQLEQNEVPVKKGWIKKLDVGDDLRVKDARGKFRKLKVIKKLDDTVLLLSPKTVCLQTGTLLKPSRKKMKPGVVGELPPREQFILLRVGDYLNLSAKIDNAILPVFDSRGELVEPGTIGCTPPQIVQKVKIGVPILFDDGKIEGVVEKVGADSFQVKITRANLGSAKLKAEKGINLPNLDLGISGLTEKDKEDLKFVAKFADIVNYSYVNSEEDVDDLMLEIEKLGVKNKIGIILKIETNLAYKNLTGILIKAMRAKHLGVMIARGDLALEVGWKNMGAVQEGILSFCSAAHIPVVWATQVLEGLAKKGIPSRSEITDITSSVQAECVMLNKGPHIHKAISFLDDVLTDIESSHDKKEVLLPKMEW